MKISMNQSSVIPPGGVTLPDANKFLVGMCCGVMTFWLFALSMTPLAPSISEDLGLPLAALSLPVGFAGLIAGILIVPSGVFADRFGCLKMFRIGILLSIAGCLICSMAFNQWALITGRLFQGMSAALIMPSTLALVKSYFAEQDRPRALSIWSMSSFGSAGVCSFFGGYVGTALGWRMIFILSIPVALLAVYLLRRAPESTLNKERAAPFDSMGFFTLLLALMAINLAVNRAPIWGWSNIWTLSCLALFIVLLPLFIAAERNHSAPIVDLSLLKNRTYNTAVIANFLLNTGLGAMFILLTYLQKGRGLTAFEASLTTLSYLVTILIMIRVGEKLGNRFGSRLPMCIGTLSGVLGFVLMSSTFIEGNSYYLVVMLGFTLMGIGNGLFATPATTIAVAEAPPNKVGAATAIFKMASSLGGALGIAGCSAVYNAVLNSSSEPEIIHKAGQFGISFCTVALFIAFLLCLSLLPRQQRVTLQESR